MTLKQFAALKTGDLIALRRPHPWAPARGQVVGFETLAGSEMPGKRPRLRLEDGHECYLIQPRQGVLEVAGLDEGRPK